MKNQDELNDIAKTLKGKGKGKKIKWLVGCVCALVIALLLTSTVDKGTYQIKQTALFGTMSAKMNPGIWWRLFGDIDTWPKANTFFFTAEKDVKDDNATDSSIEVRFNDGSLCNISGTARILLPTTKTEAVSLVTDRGHKTYADVESKLLKPTIRKVLRHTANLMSATESYDSRRAQYISYARDQIANGIYETETVTRMVKDLVSGEMVEKSFTVIKTVKAEKKDDNGKVVRDTKGNTIMIDTKIPMYGNNAFAGTGIGIKNFEVKQFKYEAKVNTQIGEQQKARMAVQTAKAKAQEAEQNKLTITAEGKARVAKAEYKELELKVVAVVKAQRNKEVAETKAAQELEVAKLERAAASENKQRDILTGEGIAKKKQLIMAADGALKEKLLAKVEIEKVWAAAFAKRAVPSVYMAGSGQGGGGTPDTQFATFMNMMNVRNAQGIALDMKVKK